MQLPRSRARTLARGVQDAQQACRARKRADVLQSQSMARLNEIDTVKTPPPHSKAWLDALLGSGQGFFYKEAGRSTDGCMRLISLNKE